MEEIKIIERLLREIGDTIADYNSEKARKEKYFTKMVSCLWNVSACNQSLEFYVENEFPNSQGGKYFYICGILQIMVAQQDAIKQLILEVSKEDWENFKTKDYNEIRAIRNDVIGHPSSVNRGLNNRRNGSESECHNLCEFEFWKKWEFEYITPDCKKNTGMKPYVHLDTYFQGHLLWVKDALTLIRGKKDIWIIKL